MNDESYDVALEPMLHTLLLNVSMLPKYVPLMLNVVPSMYMPIPSLRSTTAGLRAKFWIFKNTLALVAADENIPGIPKDH